MKIKALIILIICFFPLWAQNQDTVTASDVIEKYIKAIGGREKLSQVEDRITEMSGLVQELSFSSTVYQKKPDLFKQVTRLGEVEQTVLYDGTKAEMKINEERKEITGEELIRLKTESNLNMILESDTSKIKYQYAGKDTVNGKDVYKITAQVNSLTWTQFYDISSGFKVKDIKPMNTPQGDFAIETWYSDYRQVNGLWFPFKLKQKLGKQSMDFSITSVKVNTGIKDSVFSLDDEAGEEK